MSIAESTTQPEAPAPPDAHPCGHHRDGIRRPGHGHRAAAPRRGLRHRGEGRRHRRHLAGQQLPRLRMRRAVAPLFVLLRAESHLEQAVLAAAGDPGLPQGRHRKVRSAPLHPLRAEGEPRALGRQRIPLARLHRIGGRVRRAVPDLGRRCVAYSADTGHRGDGRIPRPRIPFGGMGPQRRLDRQARRDHRHRRQRNPDPAGVGATRRRRCRGAALPAHPAVGGAAAEQLAARRGSQTLRDWCPG